MEATPRKIAVLASLPLAILAVWLAWFCQPERQVLRHQRRLLLAVERRDWAKVEKLVSVDFRAGSAAGTVAAPPGDPAQAEPPEPPTEQAGPGRAATLELAREALRPFFSLTVTESDRAVERRERVGKPPAALIRARIRLQGNGVGYAGEVLAAVNRSPAPMLFVWQRRNWKPWDWQLTGLDHPLLRQPFSEYFP